MVQSKYIDRDDLGQSSKWFYIQKTFIWNFLKKIWKWYILYISYIRKWSMIYKERNSFKAIFDTKMTKKSQSDQNKSFQCPISFPKGNSVSLNIFLTLFSYFIHYFVPKSHSEVMRSLKMAYFILLSPYKVKSLKNVIFHDFFKLLLGVLRWCFRYVEMFLGPLEGVFTLRIHFGSAYDTQ